MLSCRNWPFVCSTCQHITFSYEFYVSLISLSCGPLALIFCLWHMQERKGREARAAEGGWTVVTHHKGRKKTTDAESGITVGSVAQSVAENKLAKQKTKEVGLDFYRFQRKEAQRNGMLNLIYEVDNHFSQFFLLIFTF